MINCIARIYLENKSGSVSYEVTGLIEKVGSISRKLEEDGQLEQDNVRITSKQILPTEINGVTIDYCRIEYAMRVTTVFWGIIQHNKKRHNLRDGTYEYDIVEPLKLIEDKYAMGIEIKAGETLCASENGINEAGGFKLIDWNLENGRYNLQVNIKRIALDNGDISTYEITTSLDNSEEVTINLKETELTEFTVWINDINYLTLANSILTRNIFPNSFNPGKYNFYLSCDAGKIYRDRTTISLSTLLSDLTLPYYDTVEINGLPELKKVFLENPDNFVPVTAGCLKTDNSLLVSLINDYPSRLANYTYNFNGSYKGVTYSDITVNQINIYDKFYTRIVRDYTNKNILVVKGRGYSFSIDLASADSLYFETVLCKKVSEAGIVEGNDFIGNQFDFFTWNNWFKNYPVFNAYSRKPQQKIRMPNSSKDKTICSIELGAFISSPFDKENYLLSLISDKTYKNEPIWILQLFTRDFPYINSLKEEKDGNPLSFDDLVYLGLEPKNMAEDLAEYFLQYYYVKKPLPPFFDSVKIGNQILLWFWRKDSFTGTMQRLQQIGTWDNSTLTFNFTIEFLPIKAGSVSINPGGGLEGGIEKFWDNGDGTLTGCWGGTGTINYTTGIGSVTFVNKYPYNANKDKRIFAFYNQIIVSNKSIGQVICRLDLDRPSLGIIEDLSETGGNYNKVYLGELKNSIYPPTIMGEKIFEWLPVGCCIKNKQRFSVSNYSFNLPITYFDSDELSFRNAYLDNMPINSTYLSYIKCDLEGDIILCASIPANSSQRLFAFYNAGYNVFAGVKFMKYSKNNLDLLKQLRLFAQGSYLYTDMQNRSLIMAKELNGTAWGEIKPLDNDIIVQDPDSREAYTGVEWDFMDKTFNVGSTYKPFTIDYPFKDIWVYYWKSRETAQAFYDRICGEQIFIEATLPMNLYYTMDLGDTFTLDSTDWQVWSMDIDLEADTIKITGRKI
jgi:hypothetical protein